MHEKNNDKEVLSDYDITSHTAAMWKYNVIPDKPEPYPEYLSRYEKNEYAEVIAARVRGKKHKHEGTNCDDWFDFKFTENSVIAVVSDGAGSKPLSRIGAKASCEAVISCLERGLKTLFEKSGGIIDALGMPLDKPEFTSACAKLAALMQESSGEAFNAVENAYLSRRDSAELLEYLGRVPELRDFSATLLAAVVVPVKVNDHNEHIVISIQLGDGMIASINADAEYSDALRVLGNADSGSFAGETEFLTSSQLRSQESLMNRTKIQRRKISSVLLMTDGVADDYYPNNPQLLKLYLDLRLNDILESKGGKQLTEVNRPYASLIPRPVSYPWVNDGDISYALQYAGNILDKTGLSLEKIWGKDMEDILSIASLKSFDIVHESNDKSEMLSVWLDNYSQRGSFDDRTLVIINV